MKILRLILQNLNSLKGKWRIDFTDPAYRDSGIFAISGSTGSGKTTILDAITLALFASTPRLAHGASVAEVVSCGTSECLAELVFEADGKVYTATFTYGSVKRGKNKGKLNETYGHRLVYEGKVIAEKKLEIQEKIRGIVGLSMDQFCRTALLAQGQFDAFLAAKPNDKSEILEQITGAGIYAQIADEVRRRNTAESAILSTLETEKGFIEILDPETENAKLAELAALETQVVQSTKDSDILDSRLQTFARIRELENRTASNQVSRLALDAEAERFAPRKIQLANAAKAEPHRAVFEQKNRLEAAQNVDCAELDHIQQKMPEIVQHQTDALRKFSDADAALSALKQKREEAEKIFHAVRALDLQKNTLDKQLAERTESRRKNAERRTREANGIRQAEAERDKWEKQIAEAENYLALHARDANLPSWKNTWSVQLSALREKRAAARKSASEETSLREQKAQAEDRARNAELVLADTAALDGLREQKRAASERLTAELSGETREELRGRENLLIENIAFIRRVLSFEQARKSLADGCPCPLCGAPDHPFAKGNAPVLGENEKALRELRLRLDRLGQCDTAVQLAENRLAELENQRKIEQERAASARKQAELIGRQAEEKAAEKLQNDHLAAQQENALREAFSLAGFPWGGKADAPAGIDERIAAFESANRRKTELAQTKIEAISRAGTAAAKLSELEREDLGLAGEMEKLQSERNMCAQERAALFGERDPDNESARLKAEENVADEARKNAERDRDETLLARKSAESGEIRLRDAVGKRAVELETLRARFAGACRELDTDERAFPALLLPPDVFAAYAAKDAEIKLGLATLETERLSLAENLTREKNALPEGPAEEDAQTEIERLRTEIAAAREKTGALRHELAVNTQAKAKAAEKLAAIETQKKQCAVWGHLYTLVSSGQNLVRFAQGITLDRLLARANIELSKLRGRYSMIRSAETPLGIDVIDSEQGGIIRASANLSGGERFLVSLALALGLSAMTGEKIRVDSLFLDEGFGSLDSDALQQALSALAKLHAAGKLVGIISHVQTIGETLPCVLEVRSIGGGWSELAGPGVERW